MSWKNEKQNYINLGGGNGWKEIKLCPLIFEKALSEEEVELFWSFVKRVQQKEAEIYGDDSEGYGYL